jgi:hypothetical protein
MKTAYLVMGALLLIAGILGFFQNPLLGLFVVDTLHNLIHVGSGIVTAAVAFRGIAAMRTWGKLFGLFYLVVAIIGAVVPGGDVLGLLHLNIADNLLHLALALFFLYYALLAPPDKQVGR